MDVSDIKVEDNNYRSRTIANGATIFFRREDPYGLWSINYEELGKNKRLAVKYMSGAFTTLEQAEKALNSYLQEESIRQKNKNIDAKTNISIV